MGVLVAPAGEPRVKNPNAPRFMPPEMTVGFVIDEMLKARTNPYVKDLLREMNPDIGVFKGALKDLKEPAHMRLFYYDYIEEKGNTIKAREEFLVELNGALKTFDHVPNRVGWEKFAIEVEVDIGFMKDLESARRKKEIAA